jgi:SAM-dependent methyltransferase
MNYYSNFFENLVRQSPGNPSCTRKILGAVRSELPAQPHVLDLGSGTGEQTLTLLQHLPGARIHAVDINPEFLQGLQQRLKEAPEPNLLSRVQTECVDFTQHLFEPQAYDLIWSEGALYFMDMGQALEIFKKTLKPGGFFVFSGLTWLVDDASLEVKNYWQKHYPQMPTLMEQMNIFENKGYDLLEVQVLPETVWWDSYYTPIQEALKALPQAQDPEALALVGHLRAEIEMYAKYGAEYSYVYYALQSR